MNIVPDNNVIESTDAKTDLYSVEYPSILAEFDDPVAVEGSFHIMTEYLCSGLVDLRLVDYGRLRNRRAVLFH